MTVQKIKAYAALMRLDKPVGILLLLWPTLWALWLANDGLPAISTLLIFCAGVVMMRSAGCVINDFADRHVDPLVARTKLRPLVTGEVSVFQALVLFAILVILSFILVLFTNAMTVWMSLVAVFLAALYPFMKRVTHLPQVVLGAAFSWSIPMAYTASIQELPPEVWLLYSANLLWTVAYDTQYAMVDREDDIKANIKSTAILFAKNDTTVIAILQGLSLLTLMILAQRAQLGWLYFLGIAAMAACFFYQYQLCKNKHPADCFKAFLNNIWAGLGLFIGIFLHYLVA
jgi:4-hydroxybenzoate polyprenyltransferase